jgi:hypothetical protein
MTTLDHTNDTTNSDTLMEDNVRIGPKDGMARMTIFEEVCLPHWSVSIEHEATTYSFFYRVIVGSYPICSWNNTTMNNHYK